jgi:proteasome accessory factor A
VRWDKAGERVVARAAAVVASRPVPAGGRPLQIVCYKNNTDGKGASYGTHENYLTNRQTPFRALVRGLTPFLVTRQVFTGAGRVGIGQAGQHAGFQLSARADFIEAEVGLETTSKRPIVNTRDEPHADPSRYRRLHVIIGDANCAELSAFLKLGTTSVVLAMIECGFLDADRFALAHPVDAVRTISHDPSLRATVELADGRTATAIDLQRDYLDAARKFVDDRHGADADPETVRLLDEWTLVLDELAIDPMRLADRLDWAAKLSLLQSYRDRDGLDWSDAKLSLVDLQYSDVRPERGLYHRLLRMGRMQRLIDDADVADAERTPPADTRAWFRGECVRRFGRAVTAASWDSVVLDIGDASLQRVPTPEPERGTAAMVASLFDRAATPRDLLALLTGARASASSGGARGSDG